MQIEFQEVGREMGKLMQIERRQKCASDGKNKDEMLRTCCCFPRIFRLPLSRPNQTHLNIARRFHFLGSTQGVAGRGQRKQKSFFPLLFARERIFRRLITFRELFSSLLSAIPPRANKKFLRNFFFFAAHCLSC